MLPERHSGRREGDNDAGHQQTVPKEETYRAAVAVTLHRGTGESLHLSKCREGWSQRGRRSRQRDSIGAWRSSLTPRMSDLKSST
jgi:hypothetical protein